MAKLDGHRHQRGTNFRPRTGLTPRQVSSCPPGVALGRSAWVLLTLEGTRNRSLVACQGPTPAALPGVGSEHYLKDQ